MSTTPTIPTEQQQQTVLAPVYTCHLCRRTFSIGGAQIIGQKRVMVASAKLVEHFGTEHKDEINKAYLMGQQFAAWLVNEQYSHNDPELAAEANRVRLNFKRLTKRVDVSDETIAKQVEKHISENDLPADSLVRKTVIGLLKGLRDSLEEIG